MKRSQLSKTAVGKLNMAELMAKNASRNADVPERGPLDAQMAQIHRRVVSNVLQPASGLQPIPASRMLSFRVNINPTPAPRMTARDKWKRRACVVEYFALKDAIRKAAGGKYPPPTHLNAVFVLEMPQSWSRKKKLSMSGEPCRVKPDVDNLLKAVMDALFENDSGVWSVSAMKRWAFPAGFQDGQGSIVIDLRWTDKSQT